MNKISGTSTVTGTQARENQQKSQKTAAAISSGSGTIQERDDLVLTNAAKQLANVRETQHSMPNVDLEKVAAIKLAVENNSYSISAERIASKIVALEKL